MYQTKTSPARIIGLLTLTLALPGVALAYGNDDAIRDCESHIRSEYGVSDLRDAQSERLNDSEHHYKVHGLAKVDEEKHPWTCEIKNRHVTSAEYSGPKPKGMGTAEKLAIGAAAVIAAGIAINEASKEGGESHSHSDAPGAAGLQDLVGARASGGEAELESRGYRSALSFKDGHNSFVNWRKGSHCVSVRTANGHFDSIVDVGTEDCGDASHQGGSHQGGAGAAGLQDLVGGRASTGESEFEKRGYDFISTSKGGDSAYTTWRKGSHCVTARTVDGHYKSIVDVTMADCE
jgi:hypothetical protein